MRSASSAAAALTNEKAYLLGKFARVGAAAPPTSTTTAASACRRRAAAGDRAPSASIAACRFRSRTSRSADVVLLVGGNPAETMPPVMRYFEAQQRARRRARSWSIRARSATARAATLHLRPTPGHRRGARQRAAARAAARRPDRPGATSRERTEGFDARPRGRRRLLARARRAHHRRARDASSSRRPRLLGTRRARDGPDRARPRAAGAGRRQRARLHQPRARARPARHARAAASACLTGQGNGQGGREHGQKADQLPGYRSHRRSRRPARTSPRVWGVDPDVAARAGQVGLRAARPAAARDGGVRALFVMGSNPVVSAPRRGARRASGSPRSTSSSSPTSSSPRRRALADVVLPVGAVGRGGRHDDQPRRPRDPAPARGGAARPACAPTSSILAGLAGAARARAQRFTYATPRGGVRRAARAPARGGPADYSGITYDADRRASSGVFWPCPSPTSTPARRGCSPTRFATPTAGRASTPVQHAAPAETPDTRLPARSSPPAASWPSTSRARRRAACRRWSRWRAEPVAEIHPQTAARLRRGRRRPRSRVRTRRGSGRGSRARLTRDIRPDTVFVPFHWAGGESANRLTNGALDPISRMPEFKVCAVRVDAVAVDPTRQPPMASRPIDAHEPAHTDAA